MTLREKVFEALANAQVNGYESFVMRPATEVADDLVTNDADIEGSDPGEVAELVLEWQGTQPS